MLVASCIITNINQNHSVCLQKLSLLKNIALRSIRKDYKKNEKLILHIQ